MCSTERETTSKQARILAILGSGNSVDRVTSEIYDSDDELAAFASNRSRLPSSISALSECFDDEYFSDDDAVVPLSVMESKKRIAATVISAIQHIKSERKENKQQIKSNFEFAKVRYTMIENAGSWKANKISAILAMRRIQLLEEKNNELKLTYDTLKQLLFKMKEQGIQNFTLSAVEQETADILYNLELAQIDQKTNRIIPRKSEDSDAELLSKLNRKILKQQLGFVKR
jgi:hypothetical protein